MIEYIAASLSTMLSIMLGYYLGKYHSPTPPQVTKKLDTILKRVVAATLTIPTNSVGPILRPSATQNYYRDNPQEAEEQRLMEAEFLKQQEGK